MDKTCAENVLGLLRERGISQMIVTDPMSVKYLTGCYVDPGERFFGLYLSEGRFVLFVNTLFTVDPPDWCELVCFSDMEDVVPLIAARVDSSRPLAVDKNMVARFLVPLMELEAAPSFPLGSFAVDRARSIKTEGERDAMRRASAMNDECIAEFARLVRPGVSEREIALQLEGIYRAHGAEGHAFPPIVSFGANAADPHHMPDETRLEPGQVVLFDVGCRLDGYCADMSRTFFFGDVGDEVRELFAVSRAATEAAEAIIKPGVLFSEIDRAARSVIADAGLGEYFMCRTGHSIGMDVHEPGDVSPVHDEPVEPGMTFSIEPGIYIPGKVGMRVEDLVLVTEDGVEVLNRFPHLPEVIEVDAQ